MIQPPEDPYEYEDDIGAMMWAIVGMMVIAALYFGYKFYTA